MPAGTRLDQIQKDLRKGREAIDRGIADTTGINQTSEILNKLKELRRRAEETNVLAGTVDRRKQPR